MRYLNLLFNYHLSKSICFSPHVYNSFKVGSKALPLSVKEYSTLGGTELYCVRVISLCSSNSFKDFVSIILVIPLILRFNSLYLRVSLSDKYHIIGSFHF